MANLFISYAHKDKAFAHRLARRLEHPGDNIWLDASTVGGNVADSLRQALTDADGVVVVLSDAALDSNHVMFELGAADALGKNIMAVTLAETTLPEPLPVPIGNTQILRGAEMTMDEIATTLRQRLVAEPLSQHQR
jgi:hypothetical protein